jgi:hypothetical protein
VIRDQLAGHHLSRNDRHCIHNRSQPFRKLS